MKYKELKEPCKSAIAKGICLGCNKLEMEFFESNPNCEAVKQKEWKQERIKL